MRRPGEQYQFQAEVSRLMEIIINSLYSNKDIFLRELISNASDALDKLRFLALTDPSVLGEGDEAKQEIQIKLDKEKGVLSIRDTGIGMTKEDLIKNLGTIARSGTSAFLEKMQKGGDLNLIGQFGVGFYSVYLVADFVEVRSKHNDDKQWVWASAADGKFQVYEDEEGEPLGRGTEILIHLKEEAGEYTTETKLKELVKRYSEFINFPIYLWSSKEVETEVPADDVEEETEEADETTDDAAEETTEEEGEEVEETEDEDEDGEPKTKTVSETKWDWELLNNNKALWLRNPKDITEEEYRKFYEAFSKEYSPELPLTWSHFSAEGDVEFKSILYIPSKAPDNFLDNYYTNKAGLKLYVRRVFISDEFDELLPKYLNFLKGIVDSDTLPLNVSREMLQAHASLKTIKKKLVRKALDMIRKLAEDDEEKRGKEAAPGDAKDDNKFLTFWNEFGKALKLGVIEDASNRVRLAKLLRFKSSKSGDDLISLDQYLERMKDGQSQIYYLTGQSEEQLQKSPFLEKLLRKGYEVLYLTDAIDEYLMQNLTEYEDRKFQNASKEDLKIGSKKDKEREKSLRESFKDLVRWWKEELTAKEVENVKVSNRLAETPCVVVTSKYGWSSNMERIMKAQALTDSSKQSYMKGRRTLEINPRHPLIKELRALVEKDPKDPDAAQVARILFETALLESGFALDEPGDFAKRIHGALKTNMKIDPLAEVEEEEEETDAVGTSKEGEDAEGADDAEEEEEDEDLSHQMHQGKGYSMEAQELSPEEEAEILAAGEKAAAKEETSAAGSKAGEAEVTPQAEAEEDLVFDSSKDEL